MVDPQPRSWGANASTVYVEALERAILEGVDEPRRPLDVALIPLFSDERPLTGLAAFFDWRSSGSVSAMLRSGWWNGDAGECILFPARSTLPVGRIVLFGLGPSAAFDVARAQEATTRMVAVAGQLSPRGVMLAMPGMGQERVIVEAVFEAMLAALRAAGRVESSGASEPTSGSTSGPTSGSTSGPTSGSTSGPTPGPTPGLTSGPTSGPTPAADPAAADDEPKLGTTAPIASGEGESGPMLRECAWWTIADPRHVARLRRVLKGPPRAARDG